MSRPMSTRKVLLWIIVAVAVLWFLSPSMWFFGNPFLHHGCGDNSTVGFHFFPTFFWGFAGVGWLVHLALALWVWWDANQRQLNGLLWGLLVFFTSVVGLLVYLIFSAQGNLEQAGVPGPGAPRPTPPPPPAAPYAREETRSCSKCGAELKISYLVCPYCAARQQRECPSCHAPAEAGWKVCPHCASSLSDQGC